MRTIRERLTYANVMATASMFIALGLGSAYAADKIGSRDIARQAVNSKHIKDRAVKSRDLARGAVKTSKLASEAVNTRKVADGSLLGVDFASGQLPRGGQGPQGEQGPPGPSTGPAGGSLTGDYPDPSLAPGAVGPPALADDAVTAAAVAPNSLGGDQIDESALLGFDRSAPAGAAAVGFPSGPSSSPLGDGLVLLERCTGSSGDVGFEVEIQNNSGSPKIVYANAITDGGTAEVTRTSVADGATEPVLDIAESPILSRHHWLTLLLPDAPYQTLQVIVQTRADGGNGCSLNRFSTIRSG